MFYALSLRGIVKLCSETPAENNVAVSPAIIMQYTGCKDTNQKEIYVGDIVTVPGICKAVVDISPELGMVYLHGGTEYACLDCTVERDYPTVIGNIYENPELLK